MKLSNEVLAEIVDIFRKGLLGEKDASQGLRDLDLVAGDDTLVLSQDYLRSHPRAELDGTYKE